MKELLHGVAPTLRYEEDNFRWDPLGTTYTIKAGYDALLDDFLPSPLWVLCKQVWKSESLPKIKIFIWILFKGKILTTNNLKKKEFREHLGVLSTPMLKSLFNIYLWIVNFPLKLGAPSLIP